MSSFIWVVIFQVELWLLMRVEKWITLSEVRKKERFRREEEDNFTLVVLHYVSYFCTVSH